MFERGIASQLCVMALALAGTTASAQSPTTAQLTISAPKADFFQGELIPLELKFTAMETNRFLADSRQYDRIGRLNFVEQFVVEPADAAEDPLAGLPVAQSGMGGLSGGPVILSEKPFAFERVLNEYVRFRRPGEFRIRVVSHRVSEVDDPAQLQDRRLLTARGKPLELVSNVLAISIRPAPATWIAQQIATARASLAKPYPPADEQTAADRRHAISVLRALGTVEATMELARSAAADDVSFAAHLAILGSPSRKELVPPLEQQLVAPGQGVSDRQIDTLAQLAEIIASGPMPEYPKDPEQRKQWETEAKRRADLRQRKQDEYVVRVIASLASKQPAARAVSLHGLLALGMRTGQMPPWLRDVGAALAGEFRELPAQIQTQLLDSYWDAIKSPALLPVLRELLDSVQLRNMALRRIYELAPGEGRNIIIGEIREPKRYFEFSTLAMLPDASLPELDDVLAQRMDALLILRYASGEIVKRVEETYLARLERDFCAGPMVFYFLKFDPPAGEKLLRADFVKPGLPPACYDVRFQFLSLGRWAYSPALERLAIESLASDKVPVKRGAAELLGRYGSAAVKKPLWETMEYFRSWWKDREGQLNGKIGDEGRQLEAALRTALANADAWVLTDAELRRLLDLCSSESCRNDIKSLIASSASPVTIQAYGSSGALRFLIGASGSGDTEWLTRKLTQFPPGVTFRILAPPTGAIARDVAEQAVRAAGRVVVP